MCFLRIKSENQKERGRTRWPRVLPAKGAGNSGGRFDLLDVNGVTGLVKRSGNDHGFTIIFSGGLLIVEREARLRAGVFQNVLAVVLGNSPREGFDVRLVGGLGGRVRSLLFGRIGWSWILGEKRACERERGDKQK